MNYQYPQNPQDPRNRPNPQYQQPYQQNQYPQQMPMQVPPQTDKYTLKQKASCGGALGVAASIATILTLFLTVGQQQTPSPQASSPASQPSQASAAYPVNIQTNYLNSCEVNASASACQCTLSWLEANVSLSQFNADNNEADQGVEPQDEVNAVRACS